MPSALGEPSKFPAIASLLDPNTLLSTLYSHTLSLCSIPRPRFTIIDKPKTAYYTCRNKISTSGPLLFINSKYQRFDKKMSKIIFKRAITIVLRTFIRISRLSQTKLVNILFYLQACSLEEATCFGLPF